MRAKLRPFALVLLLLPLVLLLLPLAACQTTDTGATTRQQILDFYCGYDGKPGAYVPVGLSHSDTPGTITQTEANNAVYDGLC